MNNKIYIAGKITGDPFYRTKFKEAAYRASTAKFSSELTQFAHTEYGTVHLRPVNPAEFTLFGRTLDHYGWRLSMVVCISKLVSCRHVYMLKDWRDSRGATIEYKLSSLMRKNIIFEDEETAPETKKNIGKSPRKHNKRLGNAIGRSIYRLMRAEYCLHVKADGKTSHTFSLERDILLNRARHIPNNCEWALTAKGPFGLPERRVTWGEVKRVGQTQKEEEE